MRDNWLSLTNLYVCLYVFYSDLLRARTFINDKYRVLHKMKYYDNNKKPILRERLKQPWPPNENLV